MKKSIYINTIMIGLLTMAFGAAAYGQVATPSETPQPMVQKQPDMRTVVLGQLGLTKEQTQQIRRLNAERKPIMDVAQNRLREANRFLDEAIYADQVSDADFQARLKEVQQAQAEVAKIRFTHEFGVRRILTPEQLVRFRDLRQKFEQRRDNAIKNGPVNGLRQGDGRGPAGGRPLRDAKQEFKQVIKPNPPRP